MSSRLEYASPPKYTNKVLVGPWFHDRRNCEASQTPDVTYVHNSTYNTDYPPKYSKPRSKHYIWEQKMRNEGMGCYKNEDGRYKAKSYWDNFTSSYDLSYNHFPKCFKGPLPRVWHIHKNLHEPADYCLPTFGSLTKHGYIEAKRRVWHDELNDPRLTAVTIHQCEFQPPTPEYYKFKKFVSTPKYNTITEEELENFKTKRRFGAVHQVIKSTLQHAYKENYRNPLTWECSPDVAN